MRTLLIFFVLFANVLSAQMAQVSGSVRDEAGQPLIGASISVANKGTLSDAEGRYALSLPAGTYALRVGYVGYEGGQRDITLAAGDSLALDWVLREAVTLLAMPTVTSGKYERALGEVTVSLEVLKPQLLENTNTIAVDQVLEKVPGVTIIDGQANIRGGSGFSYGAGSRVLLLVDDLPALQADAGFPNWNDVPVENIEQVEVVKGAASALYGSSALNGIVNVRTGYAKADPITKVSSFVTRYGAPRDAAKQWWRGGEQQPYILGGSLLHSRQMGRLDLVLSGNYWQEQSFNQDTYTDRGRLTLQTRYRISDRLAAGLRANLNRGVSGDFFFWRDNADGAHQGSRGALSTGAFQRLMLDPFVTYFDGQGNRHKWMGRYADIRNDNDNNQANHSQFYYGEYQFQRQWPGQAIVLTAGLVGNYAAVQAELYGDTTYSANNAALYVQVDKTFWTRLNASLGLRYERNAIVSPELGAPGQPSTGGTDVEAKPVLRLGLNYQAAAYTYLRASFGQGYRFPTIAEKFITANVSGIPISPNPALRSETGWSAELAAKQGFRLGGFEGFVDVAAFWTEYQNMMEFTFVDFFPTGFQSQNVGDTRIRGIEFTVAGRGSLWGLPINTLSGYTYIDPRFKDFDEATDASSTADFNVLKYRFRHTAKLDIEAQPGPFNIGVAGFYNSWMQAIDPILGLLSGIEDYRQANRRGALRLDLRAGCQVSEQLKISFIAANILNQEYSTRPGLLEAPINWTLRVDMKL